MNIRKMPMTMTMVTIWMCRIWDWKKGRAPKIHNIMLMTQLRKLSQKLNRLMVILLLDTSGLCSTIMHADGKNNFANN